MQVCANHFRTMWEWAVQEVNRLEKNGGRIGEKSLVILGSPHVRHRASVWPLTWKEMSTLLTHAQFQTESIIQLKVRVWECGDSSTPLYHDRLYDVWNMSQLFLQTKFWGLYFVYALPIYYSTLYDVILKSLSHFTLVQWT